MNHKTFLIPMLFIFGCFYSQLNEKEVLKLAEELHQHPSIKEIDDCTRSKKHLNGKRIFLQEKENESASNKTYDKEKYYKEILEEENISEEDFDYFREQLKKTKLRHYHKKENYSVFITGGMFGEIEGVLVIHNNDSIPKDGFRLSPYYYIMIQKKLGENWYKINGG